MTSAMMPIAGQDQHVDLGVREEPEQVLPQQRVAAAGVRQRRAADDQAAGQEEARAGDAVHELQDGRRPRAAGRPAGAGTR